MSIHTGHKTPHWSTVYMFWIVVGYWLVQVCEIFNIIETWNKSQPRFSPNIIHHTISPSPAGWECEPTGAIWHFQRGRWTRITTNQQYGKWQHPTAILAFGHACYGPSDDHMWPYPIIYYHYCIINKHDVIKMLYAMLMRRVLFNEILPVGAQRIGCEDGFAGARGHQP